MALLARFSSFRLSFVKSRLCGQIAGVFAFGLFGVSPVGGAPVVEFNRGGALNPILMD